MTPLDAYTAAIHHTGHLTLKNHLTNPEITTSHKEHFITGQEPKPTGHTLHYTITIHNGHIITNGYHTGTQKLNNREITQPST